MQHQQLSAHGRGSLTTKPKASVPSTVARGCALQRSFARLVVSAAVVTRGFPWQMAWMSGYNSAETLGLTCVVYIVPCTPRTRTPATRTRIPNGTQTYPDAAILFSTVAGKVSFHPGPCKQNHYSCARDLCTTLIDTLSHPSTHTHTHTHTDTHTYTRAHKRAHTQVLPRRRLPRPKVQPRVYSV